MSRKVLFFSLGFFLIFLSNCDKTENTGSNSYTVPLEVNPKSLVLDEIGSNRSISIVSNAKWTISCSETWLTVSSMSDEGNRSLTVSTNTANRATEIRTGAITVTTENGLSESVQVTQSGTEPFIAISTEEAVVNYAGEDMTIEVAAFLAWTVQIPDNINWVTVKSQTETQAVLAIASNTSGEERSATITFKLNDHDKQQTLVLMQNIPSISIDPEEASVGCESKDVTVTVDATDEWSVLIPDNVNWVSVKSQTATQAVLAIAANTSAERSATITFKLDGYDNHVTFNVKQDLYTVLLDQREFAIVDFSSAHAGNAANLFIDGNDATFWHSMYSPTVFQPPHHVTVDMNDTYNVLSIRLTRRNHNTAFDTKTVIIEGSTEGDSWIALGVVVFSDIWTETSMTLTIPDGRTLRYLRFTLPDTYRPPYCNLADLYVTVAP